MNHISKFELRQKARALFNNDMVPEHINQHNQRQWVRAVMRLGDKWLIAKPIKRIETLTS
jgi:predicted metal-dependent hydrolase